MMNKYLLQIANTLVLYSSQTSNMGLMNGKMGIILFLYHYANYADNEFYNDFAGDLLDEIMESSAHIPVDFENGLIGIGWVVDYLIKNDFIEGEPDDALQNVDSRIFSQIILNPQKSVFGQGLYLLSRINNTTNSMNDKLEQQISKLLNNCCNQFKIEDLNYSLYYLNSVLYFLLHIDRFGFSKQYYKQLAQLRKVSPDIVKKTLDRKFFNDNDLLVFYKILDSIDYRQRKKWQNILQLKNYVNIQSDSNECTVEEFINYTWLNTLYFKDNKNKIKVKIPSEEDICKFIKERQENLTIDDFLFKQGLAGLGFAIIKYHISLYK